MPMNTFVSDFVSKHKIDWYNVLIRLTILVLPWQTRYFAVAPMMGGAAWEQGRWSLYATMVMMVAVIFASVTSPVILSEVGRSPRECGEGSLFPLFCGDKMMLFAGAGGIALFVALILPTLSLAATVQGLFQMLLLAAFSLIVLSDQKLRPQLSFWIVLSLIPVALFALGQTAFQIIPGIKWLGVALQNPTVRGVSVIEIGTQRFLRAYGSFPHPNILGGWMMMGALIALREWMKKTTKSYFWLYTFLLLTIALYASFSRAAWIGFLVGVGVLIAREEMSPRFHEGDSEGRGRRRALGVAVVVAVLMIGVAILSKPELVITRVASEQRLEVKSVDERMASIKQGLMVVAQYPFGTGFEAYRVGLDRVCATHVCGAPAEPPHFVFLLALAELGWLRTGLLLMVCIWIVRRYRVIKLLDLSLALPLLVVACFDHYLWSLWAGQCLWMVALIEIKKTDGGRLGLLDGSQFFDDGKTEGAERFETRIHVRSGADELFGVFDVLDREIDFADHVWLVCILWHRVCASISRTVVISRRFMIIEIGINSMTALGCVICNVQISS